MTTPWQDPDKDGAYYERRLPGPLPLRLAVWDKRLGGPWDWSVSLLWTNTEWNISPSPRPPCASADEAKAAAEAWVKAALCEAMGVDVAALEADNARLRQKVADLEAELDGIDAWDDDEDRWGDPGDCLGCGVCDDCVAATQALAEEEP